MDGRLVRYRYLTMLLVVALVLSACGSPAGGEQGSITEPAVGSSSNGAQTDTGASGAGDVASGGMPVADDAAAPPSSQTGGDTSPLNSTNQQASVLAKVINTATLAIKVDDVQKTLSEAQRIGDQYGGRILSSETRLQDDYNVADLTLAVPSENYVEALEALRKLGKEIVTDSSKGQDVTAEFVDLESRKRNLEAAEKAVLALYAKAQTVEETLAIGRELTTIRGQLEQVQGRLNYLEDRTAYSQISLSIQPVANPQVAPPEPVPAWNPIRVVERAWNASLRVLQGVATVALSVVVFGWWLVPLLVGALMWWRRNRVRRPVAPGSSQAR